jgi:hypothetical protein
MMVEGTGSYLLGRAILTGGEERHAIFLCGYMDPRFPGFRLLHHGGQPVIDFGENDRVTRTIAPERIAGFSLTSHASFEELVDVADAVPRRSLVLVHGEGRGLDNLKAHLVERYRLAGRAVEVHAPGLGERVLFGDVPAPPGWDAEPMERGPAETLAPGQRHDRQSGFTVHGLTPDGRNRDWALIPVGRDRVALGLETERIAADRVRRLVVRGRGQAPVTQFDAARGRGDWRRFDWQVPGEWRLLLTVTDPSGQPVESVLRLFVGQELRPVRAEIDADDTVLVLEVGGTQVPQSVSLRAGQEEVTVQDWDWVADGRLLRLMLVPSGCVGTLRRLRARIRWTNGFEQEGPDVGDVTLEPRIRFQPGPAQVGRLAEVRVDSSPPAILVWVGDQTAEQEGESVRFTPAQPGPLDVWLQYPALGGGTEWRWAGSVEVRPATVVELPRVVERGQELPVRVRTVDQEFHGQELVVEMGGVVVARWTGGPVEQPITLTAGETVGPLALAVRAEAAGWTLWQGNVEVLAGLTLDEQDSLPVTTADGTLHAELAWSALREEDRTPLEAAFLAAGFAVAGWHGATLLVTGAAATVGRGVVPVPGAGPPVSLWTLGSLEVRLDSAGPYRPGQVVGLTAGGAPLDEEGPLRWEVDRVAPLLDALSARLDGGQVTLLHPGQYAIALTARGRRLAEATAEVSFPAPPVLAGTRTLWHRLDRSVDDAVAQVAGLPTDQTVVPRTETARDISSSRGRLQMWRLRDRTGCASGCRKGSTSWSAGLASLCLPWRGNGWPGCTGSSPPSASPTCHTPRRGENCRPTPPKHVGCGATGYCAVCRPMRRSIGATPTCARAAVAAPCCARTSATPRWLARSASTRTGRPSSP